MPENVAEAGEIVLLPVSDLQLDPENPRLPEDMLGKNQSELLEWLDDEETLDELAASMLSNGFFAHEPLVVLQNTIDDAEPSAKYTVVEGNRRFATLSILLQTPAAAEADLSFEFENPPTTVQLANLQWIPCLVVTSPEAVRKFLGFRHIGGLKTWSPEAKARYLEDEILQAVKEESRAPFRDVGRRVGSNATGVRNSYVALRILRHARDELGLQQEAGYILRERFGVWTRLLNSAETREYIEFGDPRSFEEIQSACASLNTERLGRVLSDLTIKPGATRAVLQDSRDATNYGRVIGNERARETLSSTGSLDLAYQVVDRTTLADRLSSYTESLDLIVRAIDSYDIDALVVTRAQGLAASARSLATLAKERHDGEDY